MLRGSANVGAFGTGTVESYDSATATRRSMILGVAPSRAACSVWKPESPLPFDPGDLAVAVGSKNWYLSMFDQYTSSVRAALAEADPNLPVQATVCVGRKAWRVVFPLRMYMGMGAKKLKTIGRVTVAVDRQTGILLYARYAVAYGGAAGRAWEEYRVDRLDLSPTLEPGWNVVRFPARAPVTVTDNGTRFSPLVKVVQRSWPLLPLAPRATPQGYRLSLASTNGMDYPPPYAKPQPSLKRRWEVGRVTYKRPYWSAPDARVQLVYRHGYSAFAVETYPLPAMGPYQALGDQMRAGGQDVRLTSGRLKGRLARIWVLPGNGGGPLLVCYDEREVVVIWGDLTRSELLMLANSLKALGDVNKPLPVTL